MKYNKINGKIEQTKDNRLTLTLFLTKEQKEVFVLQKGIQPDGIMKVVIL